MTSFAASPRRTTAKLPILGAVCLAALAMPFSFTAPALALEAIEHTLGGTPLALVWVTNAFMLGFGSCLMAFGALADRCGRKRVFLAGTLAFALASLCAAHASSVIWLDWLRAAQGIAGAAALSAGAAALAQEFDGHERTRAFSLLGTTFGVGLACGPMLAGWLIEHFSWRSVFVGTALLTTLAVLAGARYMRETRDPTALGFDWLGAATFTAALALFTCAVLDAPSNGWDSARVVTLLATSAVFAAAFVIVEGRVRQPMLDLSLFRYARFVGVQFLAAAPAYSYVVLLVLLPVRFVGIEGHDTMTAGRMMFALSAPMLVVPLVAGWLARRMSAGVVAGAGLLICAVGQLWLAQCGPGQSSAALYAAMTTIGCGIGLPWGLMDGLAVSVVPKERAGMAAGIFNTTRVAGEGVALAVVAALLAGLVATQLHGFAQGTALREAAGRLAMGDLAGALSSLPQASRASLVAGYGEAFRVLLRALACVTVLSAATVFGFLGRLPESMPEDGNAELEPVGETILSP